MGLSVDLFTEKILIYPGFVPAGKPPFDMDLCGLRLPFCCERKLVLSSMDLALLFLGIFSDSQLLTVPSDVLRRHVDQHSQESGPTRTLVACSSCHERKLKCDDNVICQSCVRNSTVCNRVGRGQESVATLRVDTHHETRNDAIDRNDQMPISATNDVGEMYTFLHNSDGQQAWSNSLPTTWPSTVSAVGLDTSLPNLLAAVEADRWIPGHGNTGPVEDFAITSSTEDFALTLPTTNFPRTSSSSSALWQVSDQDDRSVSKTTVQSPASSQDHRAIDLRGYLECEPEAVRRLIEVYFAEIHPCWPILHASSFDAEKAPHLLIGSMVILAGWLKNETGHAKLVSHVLDEASATLNVRTQTL